MPAKTTAKFATAIAEADTSAKGRHKPGKERVKPPSGAQVIVFGKDGIKTLTLKDASKITVGKSPASKVHRVLNQRAGATADLVKQVSAALRKRAERIGSIKETARMTGPKRGGTSPKAPAPRLLQLPDLTSIAAGRETALAQKLVAEVSKNNADVNSLCGTYGLKREELGRLTGFSLRALAEWAGGKRPSQPAKRRLHEVRRLLDALAEIVEPAALPHWLHQPNPGFDRLTPLQVIEVGEIDRLWAMVHDLNSGQPT